MLGAAAGLTEVRTEDLKTLLRMVHRAELRFPLDAGELARVGLQHCATEMLAMLRDLDQRAVNAVAVAVIAERLPVNKQNAIRRELRS